MKIGMILEGGAMRGLYTAGVLDVLLENNIEVDGYIGISAGAVFGCNYKSKQIERVLRYNLKYGQDPRYFGLKSLLKTGDLYGVDFCYHKIPEELDPFDNETFISNPVDFYVGITEVETGKPAYHLCKTGIGEDLLWMQASASMPLVSNPVSIDHHLYLDGGISDPIPLKYFQSIGYEKNIVVLTQTQSYRKKPMKFSSIMKKGLKKYPAIYNAMKERHQVYNKTLEYIEDSKKKGETFVIRPSHSLSIKRLENDPIKLNEAYYLGRNDAYKKLNELKAFLKR